LAATDPGSDSPSIEIHDLHLVATGQLASQPSVRGRGEVIYGLREKLKERHHADESHTLLGAREALIGCSGRSGSGSVGDHTATLIVDPERRATRISWHASCNAP